MPISPQGSERLRIFRRIVVASLPLTLFATAWTILPAVAHSTRTICLFRIATGRPCVFCGLTRAFAYAAHGDFAMASAFHPYWWVFVLLILAASTVAGVDLVKKTNRLENLWGRVPLWSTTALLLFLSFLRWV